VTRVMIPKGMASRGRYRSEDVAGYEDLEDSGG
jgi:hypothetical protein